MKKYLIVLLNVAFMQVAASNVLGTPVLRFGANGIVSLGAATHVYFDNGVVDDQQRIVAVGQITDRGAVVVRFLSNGAIDTSFNGVGYVLFTYTGTADIGTCVAFYQDKIFVGGDNGGDTADGFIASFNEDGSFNTAWGDDGIFGLSNNPYHVFSIVPQTDGKIVACGFFDDTHGYVARTNTTGTGLDATFNASGTPGYQLLSDGYPIALSCVLDSEENIIVCSTDNTSSLVYMFNVQGLPNTAFNETGKSDLLVNFAAMRLLLQQSGSIVVIGYNPVGLSIYLVRITPTGEVDVTFGINGTVTIPFTGYGYSLMSGINNTFYAGCYDFSSGYGKIVAYGVNGALNTSWGNNGIVSCSSMSSGVLALQSSKNGAVLAIGSTESEGLLQEFVEYVESILGITGSQFAAITEGGVYVITPQKVYATPVTLPSLATLATRTILAGL